MKNSKVIDNLILDVKLESTLKKTKSTKPVMPTVDSFRRQLVNFQQRLGDTTVTQKLDKNIL